MSVDVDSHLAQLRARGAREAIIRPATAAHPMIEARCEGGDAMRDAQADVPSAKWLRAHFYACGFCNSHQVSHFGTFFINARAEISIAESHFYLQKKHRTPRRTLRMGREGQAIDSSIPWRFPCRGSLVARRARPGVRDSPFVEHVHGVILLCRLRQ
ncbi:hypothetical protein CQW23_35365 [Capsicum baccatum]|uniref:Uncharacterized protein n=1 Tax=Capsicum baccatum TaxID=33114 RepID=A0A2G2UW58_CAPBA|nr:hypothetical protein CQW23_35365 [Capsicum baccatum]